MRVQIDDQVIVRQKGESAGQLLSTWRLLRDQNPDKGWQEWFTVWGQHSSTCDAVLAVWVSDHIAQQKPDQPKMVVTDCLGASWAPATVQQYWINNQPALPMAPGIGMVSVWLLDGFWVLACFWYVFGGRLVVGFW